MYPHTNAQNYTPSIKQSQIDLISKMFTKNDWIKNLTNFDSDFYVLIKEEVEELFFNTNGYLNYLDFESVYRLSVEMTIYQIYCLIYFLVTLFLFQYFLFLFLWHKPKYL